jgi:hypothetical protein
MYEREGFLSEVAETTLLRAGKGRAGQEQGRTAQTAEKLRSEEV